MPWPPGPRLSHWRTRPAHEEEDHAHPATVPGRGGHLHVLGGTSMTAAQEDEVAAGPSAAPVDRAAGTSGVTVEILSDRGVIPLEAIPPDADHISFARTVVRAGVSGAAVSAEPQSWANLEYAQQGAVWGTTDERTRVWHADGTTDDFAAGVSSRLAAGDVALYWNGGAASEFENRGPEAYVSFFLGAGNSHIPATSSRPHPVSSGSCWTTSSRRPRRWRRGSATRSPSPSSVSPWSRTGSWSWAPATSPS